MQKFIMRHKVKQWSNLFGSYPCVIAMLIILSQLFAISLTQVVVAQHHTTSSCSIHGPLPPSHHEWVYNAPARFVPNPAIDPKLQSEFTRLFIDDPYLGNGTYYNIDDAPEDNSLPPDILQSDLDYISQLCPKDAFFYSLSPQHVVARNLLQQYLADQPTPRDVLRVARIILKNHEINPKIWYYAFVGAALERSDMNGILIAQPLDAMPDLFVPSPVLNEALDRFRVYVGIGGNPYSASAISEQRVEFHPELNATNFPAISTQSMTLSKRRGVSSTTKERVTRQNGRRRKLLPDRLGSTAYSTQSFSSNLDKHIADVESYVTAASTSAVTFLSPPRGNHTKVPYGHKRTHWDSDEDYSELKRLHERSNNSTRGIRQRILQRRQRRRSQRRKVVKRQVNLYGSSHLHHDGIGECVLINGTVGADNGIENTLWYFREDIMVNEFHWYWHQYYPLNRSIEHGNRRAELFFFVHRNLVARYNAERLSNGMPRTVELHLRPGAVVEDGYNSHLIDMNSRKFWTPREPHTPLNDILHEQDPDFARNLFVKDLTDLYYKFIYSIKDGALVGPNAQPVPIRNKEGIDLLANAVEATELSPNPNYYDMDGIHNLGHQMLGLLADPQFLGRLPTGVMADTSVTMRDPLFYTFHSTMDNLFDKYKRTLPPYQLYEGEFPLVWDGVEVNAVEIVPHLGDGHSNSVRSYWSTNRFPLESGIDNSIHGGDVKADICALHLDHEPFTFKITLTVNPCVHSLSSQGMVRIFMAPRYDEQGHRFPLKVQRRLMFQLDAFPAKLQTGRNLVYRSSQDSSLTKPWSKSLRSQFFKGLDGAMSADYCGCGWPRHLLMPKGSPHGMAFDLFAMITNFDEDIVRDDIEDLKVPEPCNSPYLFCGVPWRKYPDARPMGYPFDRMPYKIPVNCGYSNVVCKLLQPDQWYRPVESLEEYVHAAPNMASSVVTIQHVDTIVR